MGKKHLIVFYLVNVILFFAVPSCKKNSAMQLPPTSGSGSDTVTTVEPSKKIFDSIPVIVWIEADANFARLSTAGKMDSIFQKLYAMGARAVVMDVKGVSGLVSYNSSIAQQLKSWNGSTQAADFDYLKNAVTEAKKQGLKVFASMSVFSEGFNYYGQKFGKVYTDTAISAVQSQVMTASGSISKISDVYTYGMLNPAQPFAQSYELSLLKEVVSNYDIDGIVLDYCRYYDITSDFSDYSISKFQQWASLSNIKTADIVKSWKLSSDGTLEPDITGQYYNKWLEFRAQIIHDFVQTAHTAIKSIKPNLPVCAYVGAWYDSYYDVGVNWASDTYDPSKDGYTWATGTYKNTGYAELLDMCMTGNYTPTLTGSGWWTVQGEISGTKKILNNANVYYGSIDIGNTQWANMDNLKQSVEMIIQQTKGIMLFDLVHIDDPQQNQFSRQLYGDLKDAIDIGISGK